LPSHWPAKAPFNVLRKLVCILDLASGVSRLTILRHLEQKKYNAQILSGRTISGLLTAAAPLVSSSFESVPKARNNRLAECSMIARIKDDSAVGRSEALPEGKTSVQIRQWER
jgi:hypothetical protein